jgi:hypothetical protein
MGVDAEFRNLLREVARLGFFPTAAGNQFPRTGPDSACHIGAFGMDMNAVLRRLPLYDGVVTFDGFRIWREVLRWLEMFFLKLFSTGIRVIVCNLDGYTPENKGKEQQSRADDHFAGLKGKRDPIKWPTVDDGKPWFLPDAHCGCLASDIYYGGPLAKRKWYEFITGFLMYDIKFPPNCEIVVDCGALAGEGMLRKPVRTRYESNLGPDADWELFLDAMKQGTVRRIVEDLPGEIPYNTWTEADDRMIYMMYRSTVHPTHPTNYMIESEDGDIQLNLMTSFHTRHGACTRPKRVFLRRHEQIGQLIDEKGIKKPKKQYEWIDIDSNCRFVKHWLGGVLSRGINDETDAEYAQRCDPIVFFCLLALMCKNDYAEGFRGMSARNLLRGTMNRPDLARRALDVQRPRYTEKDTLAAAAMPYTCRLNAEAFYQFLNYCYANAHKNHRLAASQYPCPSPLTVYAVAARIGWALDKCVNAGRPGYRLSNPFMLHPLTSRPVYGYEQVIVTEERKDGDAVGQQQPPKKRKKCIYTEFGVHPQTFYGVTHE